MSSFLNEEKELSMGIIRGRFSEEILLAAPWAACNSADTLGRFEDTFQSLNFAASVHIFFFLTLFHGLRVMMGKQRT